MPSAVDTSPPTAEPHAYEEEFPDIGMEKGWCILRDGVEARTLHEPRFSYADMCARRATPSSTVSAPPQHPPSDVDLAAAAAAPTATITAVTATMVPMMSDEWVVLDHHSGDDFEDDDS